MRESVPREFTVGESLAWKKSFCDYPASDGWIVTYYVRGAGTGFDVEGIADGDDVAFTVAGSTTANCTVGKYYYQAFAEKDDERFLVDKGEVNVLTGFGSIGESDTVDNRSKVKKILDAIDARLEGDVSKGVLEYTIGDRQLKRYSLKELTDLRKYYGTLYSREVLAERRKKGKSLLKTYKIRFNRTT